MRKPPKHPKQRFDAVTGDHPQFVNDAIGSGMEAIQPLDGEPQPSINQTLNEHAFGRVEVVSPSDDAAESSAAPRIVATVTDYAAGTVTLRRSDGKEARFPLKRLRHTTAIARATHFRDGNLLFLETVRDEALLVELPGCAPVGQERPVVYLDQNKWSFLAKHIRHRGNGAEHEAAQRLIELAMARRVILPMSAGHMFETCKWTKDSERYELALTILCLSHGWQMRHPLDVRRDELRAELAAAVGNAFTPPAAFTLAAGAVHRQDAMTGLASLGGDLPPDAAAVLRTLTAVQSSYATMLDKDHVEGSVPEGWARALQECTDWLATAGLSPKDRRERMNMMFLSDLKLELARAALEADVPIRTLEEWITGAADEAFGRMPSLGLFRETLIEKLGNAGTRSDGTVTRTRWKTSDLIDLMYLTCAAGHGALVVAERSLVAQMQSALSRLGRPQMVFRSFPDAVAALETLTVQRAAAPPRRIG